MAQYVCCLPRKGWFLVLVIISVFVMLTMTGISRTSTRLLREDSLEQNIAVMQTRLKFLESQYEGRHEDLYNVMQAKYEWGNQTSRQETGNEQNTTFSPELTALLKTINGSKSSDALLSSDEPELIKAPFSLRIMPHLLDNVDSLRPAYQFKSTRHYADYIIGIPHVKRDKETYLFETLKVVVLIIRDGNKISTYSAHTSAMAAASLLTKMSDEDMNSTMIVVMIGETDLNYVIETTHTIERTFPSAMNIGLIEVISPRKYYYPNFEKLAQTLGDSLKRVKWRTKQNLDAIFLMAFAQSRCLYYLMIEDDVLAENNFMTDIRKFTAETTVSNPNWFFIQYSTTGGIGKLFRSTDLIHFMTYVQLFYSNMPIDWLTESYLADRTCGINKGAKECADAKTKIRPTFRKNLFKHIGYFSSLKGKLQNVKGAATVNKVATFFPHNNPPVSKIKCDLSHHNNYTIENAYHGISFFWGKKAKEGDVIEFWFENPTDIGRYTIRSGNVDHPKDKIIKAGFEILPDEPDGSFMKINDFDEFGLVEGTVNEKYGDLLAVRIHFDFTSPFWVVINEIEFVDRKKEKET